MPTFGGQVHHVNHQDSPPGASRSFRASIGPLGTQRVDLGRRWPKTFLLCPRSGNFFKNGTVKGASKSKRIVGSVGTVGEAHAPAITAEQFAKMVGKPAPVPKDPKARKRTANLQAVGGMKGVLDLGPKKPQRSYLQKRCKMLQGKTPQQAISLQYVDASLRQ